MCRFPSCDDRRTGSPPTTVGVEVIASNRQRLQFVSGMRSVGTRSQRARKELEAAFESRRWQPKSGSGEHPPRDNRRKDQAAACSVLMSFVRTLPIRVEPEDGEALDSWLETIARRTCTAFGDLLCAVRVPPQETELPGPTSAPSAPIHGPTDRLRRQYGAPSISPRHRQRRPSAAGSARSRAAVPSSHRTGRALDYRYCLQRAILFLDKDIH
jgi:hypothetical protein